MSSFEDPAWWALFILELITLSLAILRTRYNKRVTEGSEKYWTSWKERQADIARKVIEGMSDEEVLALMKKLEAIQNGKKRKKSKELQRIERRTESTTQ